MRRTTTTSFFRAALLSLVLVSAYAPRALAQGPHQHGQGPTRMLLSTAADFSTNDHVFQSGDVIHLLLRAPGLDVASIEQNEFSIHPRGGGDAYVGVLTNHLDGTFTAAFAVDDLDTSVVAWQARATLSDATGVTVEGRANFVVGTRHRQMHTYRLHGAIELIGDGFVVVGGQEIRITARTQLRSTTGPLLLLDLHLNQRVTVVVQQTPDGPVALSITLHAVSDEDVVVEGTITDLSEDGLWVDGFALRADAETEVVWRASVLDLTFLQVGMGVRVRAVEQDDGTFYAGRIEVEALSEIEVMIRGAISAIEGDEVSIGETSFTVTSTTRIIGQRGERPGVADLEVGDYVMAVLIPDGDGGHLAVVLLTDRDGLHWRFGITGRIDSLGADYVFVGGHRFGVTSETSIRDRHGEEIPFGMLEAGHTVRVRARIESDTVRIAEEIQLRARAHGHGRMLGTVAAVSEEELVVDGVSFQLAALTTYRGGVQSAADLTVGQHVLVHFVTLADDTKLALMVVARPDPPSAIVLRGAIDAVGSQSITVLGTEVWLRDETIYIAEDGSAATAADLSEGQMVAVHARSTVDGLVAIRIKMLPSIVINAPVEQSSGMQLRIGGHTVLLTDETLIVGSDNAVKPLSALQAGMYVEVLAVAGDAESDATGGTLVADRVLVTGSMTATELEEQEAASLPGTFVLDQNYPNPFNPSTTIAFRINGAQAVRATLTVFNVLGQRVATLVEGTLEPGVHEVQWNAVEDGGSGASNGVYLYRLEVDGRAETRSMILLK